MLEIKCLEDDLILMDKKYVDETNKKQLDICNLQTILENLDKEYQNYLKINKCLLSKQIHNEYQKKINIDLINRSLENYNKIYEFKKYELESLLKKIDEEIILYQNNINDYDIYLNDINYQITKMENKTVKNYNYYSSSYDSELLTIHFKLNNLKKKLNNEKSNQERTNTYIENLNIINENIKKYEINKNPDILCYFDLLYNVDLNILNNEDFSIILLLNNYINTIFKLNNLL